MHQQKFAVISFFLIRCSFRDIWKNDQNETTKLFSVGKMKIKILTNQG